jgi:hypothetical protein
MHNNVALQNQRERSITTISPYLLNIRQKAPKKKREIKEGSCAPQKQKRQVSPLEQGVPRGTSGEAR